MTVTPINPLVLAYVQPEGEGRNRMLEFRSSALITERKRADAQDSLDLSERGQELARINAGALNPVPSDKPKPAGFEHRPSRGLDLLT